MQDESYLRKLAEKMPDVGKKMEYMLNTGNLVSKSGLDLSQAAGFTVVAEKLNFFRCLHTPIYMRFTQMCLELYSACFACSLPSGTRMLASPPRAKLAQVGADCAPKRLAANVPRSAPRCTAAARLGAPSGARMPAHAREHSRCRGGWQVPGALPVSAPGGLLRAAAHHGGAQAAAGLLGLHVPRAHPGRLPLRPADPPGGRLPRRLLAAALAPPPAHPPRPGPPPVALPPPVDSIFRPSSRASRGMALNMAVNSGDVELVLLLLLLAD